MKKVFSAICLATALQFSPLGDMSIASAHNLPKDELVIGGIGYGGTLGYVREIYGEPEEIRTYQKKGVKGITYIYSKHFIVSARAKLEENLPDESYPVVGFMVSENSMKTETGIRVGLPFKETIEDKYGKGLQYKTENDEIFYQYQFDNGKTAINYFVNDRGLITKIYMGTDF